MGYKNIISGLNVIKLLGWNTRPSDRRMHVMTAVVSEPTPVRTGAGKGLRPLGRTVRCETMVKEPSG